MVNEASGAGNSNAQTVTTAPQDPVPDSTINDAAVSTSVYQSSTPTQNTLPSSTAAALAVVSTEPADNASGVPIDAFISIAFNENIQLADSSTISLTENGASVPGAVYGASVPITASVTGCVLSISPQQELQYNSQYSMSVPAGAVTDSTGETIPDSLSFLFTTQAQPAPKHLVTNANSTPIQTSAILNSQNGGSKNVGVLDESYNGYQDFYSSAVGYFYPSDYPDQTFTELNPSTLSGAALQNYDTLLFFEFNPVSLSTTQRQSVVNWVYNGGKVIIWTADAVPYGATWDFQWLPYPFTSSSPGQAGAIGEGLQIVENGILASSDPASPYYIDTNALNNNSDAVGDANVMVTYSSGWHINMIGKNTLGVNGPVNSYAPYGAGLFIYSALDWDYANSSSGQWLKKMMKQELGVGTNVTALPNSTLGKPSYCLFGRGSINLSTGNFIHQETDFNIPSVGPPLAFTRFYNSQDSYVGPQGRGWTNNLNVHLTVNTDGSVDVAYADGHAYRFNSNSGTYTAPPGCYETLARNADGAYTLVFKDHTKCVFNSTGQLIGITDQNNNTITLAYSNNLLATATDSLNRSLTFAYDTNNYLASITDPIGRTVSYTYDTKGNLITIKDINGGNTQYQYDTGGAHNLTRITQPGGNTILTNTYNANNQVATQADGERNTWTYAYTADQRTVQTGPLGETTTCARDDKYRGVSITDPLGGRTAFNYDDNNNRISVDDANGHINTFTYDANGNMLTNTRMDTDGTTSLNAVSMSYDTTNDLLSITDNAGKTTSFQYDANYNLSQSTDPSSNITKYYYNGNGQVTEIDSPGEQGSTDTTKYTYLNGMPYTVTSPANVTTTYTYDSVGRPVKTTDSAGSSTTYAYDAAGNLLTQTDPLGNQVSYSYDANGNMLTATDARGKTPVLPTTTTICSSAGRTLWVIRSTTITTENAT